MNFRKKPKPNEKLLQQQHVQQQQLQQQQQHLYGDSWNQADSIEDSVKVQPGKILSMLGSPKSMLDNSSFTSATLKSLNSNCSINIDTNITSNTSGYSPKKHQTLSSVSLSTSWKDFQRQIEKSDQEIRIAAAKAASGSVQHHEPVNYIRLRRNTQSQAALERNRTVNSVKPQHSQHKGRQQSVQDEVDQNESVKAIKDFKNEAKSCNMESQEELNIRSIRIDALKKEIMEEIMASEKQEQEKTHPEKQSRLPPKTKENSPKHAGGNSDVINWISTHKQAAPSIEEILKQYKSEHSKHVNSPDIAVIDSLLTDNIRKLEQEQAKLQSASQKESAKLENILHDIRNNISIMYRFTPIFKLVAKRQKQNKIAKWKQYVVWHRQEMERLLQLTEYAVTIQRSFRRRRARWEAQGKRLTMLWKQWQAVIKIQKWFRITAAKMEVTRKQEAAFAAKIEAAWRGRVVRKQVKTYLKDYLRMLLRQLSPTGSLYRLHELALTHPDLARTVNAIMTLVEETRVQIDATTGKKAVHARAAALAVSTQVEATRKQLFHAIWELKAIVETRRLEIEKDKNTFVQQKKAREDEKTRQREEEKRIKYLATKERLNIIQENETMFKEEIEMREYIHMLKTIDTDEILHAKKREIYREREENSKMIIEEYQMQYFISETRRRAIKNEKKIQEIKKQEALRQVQAQEQLQHFLQVTKEEEIKRIEMQFKRHIEKEKRDEFWLEKTRQEQELVNARLKEKQDRIKAFEDAELALKKAQEDEIQREKIEKEQLRLKKVAELEREAKERDKMSEEEKWMRKYISDVKKKEMATTWQQKREKEAARFSLDPLSFGKLQAQKEREEKERKERYWMKKEDDLAQEIEAKERKRRYLEECKRLKRLKLEEEARNAKETKLMQIEDEEAEKRRQAIRKAEEYKQTLKKMQKVAQVDKQKEEDRLFEAKNRKMMHNEEMRQRRYQQMVEQMDALREKHETKLMEEEEMHSTTYEYFLRKKESKRRREKRNLEMMKEDVFSMERQDWEQEGLRIEKLLWHPEEASTFAHLVPLNLMFLRANVELLRKLCELKGPPPYNMIDWDAANSHIGGENSMTIDQVPKKRRKRKKFFYHEFFEEDPILPERKSPPPSPTEKMPAKPNTEENSKRARSRWKMLSEHFFRRTLASDVARKGLLLMHSKQFEEACKYMLEAVRLQKINKSSPSLLRQLARAYFEQWNVSLNRVWLQKSLFYFQCASQHVILLTSPTFLQEVALALERNNRFKEAAKVIGGIISCFPKYRNLNEVIFRGGIVMIALKMYHQSREYLLHTMEDPPYGWKSYDIVFIAARVLQFEAGQKRLCSVAYDEAYRKNRSDRLFFTKYKNWQEWVKDADTWRNHGDRCFQQRELLLAKDAYQIMMKRRTEESAKSNDQDWLRLAKTYGGLNERALAQKALIRWFSRKNYSTRAKEKLLQWSDVRWKLLGLETPRAIIEAREYELKAQQRRRAQREARLSLTLIKFAKQQEMEKKEKEERERLEEERKKELEEEETKQRVIAWGVSEEDPLWSEALRIAEASGEPDELYVNFYQENGQLIDQGFSYGAVSRQTMDMGAWKEVEDPHSHKIYYWNEETDEVSWD